MSLPKLYRAFYKEKVFNFSDVMEKFKEDKHSEGYLRKRLNDFSKQSECPDNGHHAQAVIITLFPTRK